VRLVVLGALLAVVTTVIALVLGASTLPSAKVAAARSVHAVPPTVLANASRRSSATAAHGLKHSLTITWVGDTTLGSRLGLPAANGLHEFDAVKRLLRRSDIAVGNNEGTFSRGAGGKCGRVRSKVCFAFQAPPANARALASAGFTLMNLANNHAQDFGAVGEEETVTALKTAGIAVTGRPSEITVVRRHGTRVAFVGCAAYPWAGPFRDLAAARALVAQARARADIVVVVMHAGAEGSNQAHTPVGEEHYLGENRGDTRAFAHAVIDAGANLVVGSGPHVIRGLERYHGRLIAYSLGNFEGVENFSRRGVMDLSALLTVRLAPDGQLVAGRWQPLALVGHGQPAPDPSARSTALVRQVSAADFGSNAFPVRSDGWLVATPAKHSAGA
jgi:poly-gamma-glutamate capsule biosynthesis protein CapA/YwtB (metallophosphatase superfamily)